MEVLIRRYERSKKANETVGRMQGYIRELQKTVIEIMPNPGDVNTRNYNRALEKVEDVLQTLSVHLHYIQNSNFKAKWDAEQQLEKEKKICADAIHSDNQRK